MFSYSFSDELRKRVSKLSSKDPVLARIMYKKINEIIRRDRLTINAYKNLKSPQNEFKRIHLTSKFVLLFIVNKEQEHIYFTDVVHGDNAYD